jgi:hypothetical protein
MVTMACRTALAGRRAPVKAKGAAVRCRGRPGAGGLRAGDDLLDAGTARLLPREHVLTPCSPNHHHRWQFWGRV